MRRFLLFCLLALPLPLLAQEACEPGENWNPETLQCVKDLHSIVNSELIRRPENQSTGAATAETLMAETNRAPDRVLRS